MLPEANIKHASGGNLVPRKMPSSKQAVPQLLFQKITGLVKARQRNFQETWDLLEWQLRGVSNGTSTKIWEIEPHLRSVSVDKIV